MFNILIADDEKGIRSSLEMILSSQQDYQLLLASDGGEAMQILQNEPIDLMLLDLKMPVHDGFYILKNMPDKEVITIVFSGFADLETAVQAMKHGAYDFIEKPLTKEHILLTIRHALENKSMKQENRQLKESAASQYVLIYKDQRMVQLIENLERIAPTNATILLHGESGTGKEVFAYMIHQKSKRAGGAFIKVNCSAIPDTLIESELFGYEKGSFTGAFKARKGKFELAHKGTLFLDEIGEMSLTTQVKILRVLQDGEFERVGGEKPIRVDVRLIVATNKNLAEEVIQRRFREDLFYRINVISYELPPLRKRIDDIPMIISYYLERFCKENGLPLKTMSPTVYKELMSYQWPGNVRELKNLVERLVIISKGKVIEHSDLEGHTAIPIKQTDTGEVMVNAFSMKDIVTLRDYRAMTERAYLSQVLDSTQWNITQASQLLGIERTYLHRKIRQYGLRKVTSTQVDAE